MRNRKYLTCPIDDEHYIGYDCRKCWNRACPEHVRKRRKE